MSDNNGQVPEAFAFECDVKYVLPGGDPKEGRLVLQQAPGPRQKDVYVKNEKNRLLAKEDIIPPTADNFRMFIVFNDRSKGEIEMKDEDAVINYQKELCQGGMHIEFKYV